MKFTSEEIAEFKVEATELLEHAERGLIAIDEGRPFSENYNLVFRGFHNLKGASGMMEFGDLQKHTHQLETLFVKFKEQLSIPSEYINLFLRGVDAARSLLAGKAIEFNYELESKLKKEQESYNIEFMEECEEILERCSLNVQKLESGSQDGEIINIIYRDMHTLKGSAYLFSYPSLGDLAHKVEEYFERLRSGQLRPNKEIVDYLFTCIDMLNDELKKIKNPNSPSSTQAKGSSEKIKATEKESKKDSPTAQQQEEDSNATIRVSTALLDRLMTFMGEMVLVRNQVLQFSSRSDNLEFLNLSKRLNVVTGEIQGEMMKTRMQPIGNVLSKFNRVVRDLSNELNKKVTFKISGAETELDKSLLEAIKDPLTHIVRNSCDHGIEAPDQRKIAGKSETGSISIRAFHEGGHVVIEVSDDGKGLHRDKLISKAIQKGIVTEAQSKQMSDKEVCELIFHPGFSTAEKVTNVSGRGVGMDVVKTNVEKIGGTVELTSEAGLGTTTHIKIPLTLAIVPALMIKCRGGIFAIPQVKLVELVRVDQQSENRVELLHGSLVFRLRGELLPLVDLNQVLNIASKENETRTLVNIAVLNADEGQFGLIVDEIQDTADIVVKPINRLLKSLQVYSAATILGDGNVALILDVLGLSKIAKLSMEKRKQGLAKDAEAKIDLIEYLILKVNSPAKHAIPLKSVHRLEEFNVSQIEYSGKRRVIRYRNHVLPVISMNEQLGYEVKKETNESIPIIVVDEAGKKFGLEVNEILDTLSTSAVLESDRSQIPSLVGSLNTEKELIVIVDPREIIKSSGVTTNEAA